MKTKGFWARVFSDWPAKVLSLGLAVLVFVFYSLNRLEVRYLSIPLAVTTNDEYVPGSQYPRSVRLSLKGETNELFQIQEADLKATADFSGVRAAGLAKAVVTIEKRGAALDIDPLEITAEPGELAVRMERRASRTVPVTPAFHGALEPGFNLKSFDLSPGEVEVVGPESTVEKVTDMATEPIELTGRMSDFLAKAHIVRANPLVSVSGSDVIEFRATVERSASVKAFVSLPIVVLGLASDLALESALPTARVSVKTLKGEVHGVELGTGSVSVDFSGIRKPGAYTLPVALTLPEGVVAESLEPALVTVKVLGTKGQTE